MVVYLLHEYVEDLHSVLAVYQSVDKAVASARGIAEYAGLYELEEDSDTAIDYGTFSSNPSGSIMIEFSNDQYDAVVWVESMEVIE
jgi:hypothetical protein